MTKMNRFVPALLLAAGVMITAPACAARVYETGYPRGGYPPPPRADYLSNAARSGYRDGLDAGRDAARHGDRFDPVRDPAPAAPRA